MNSECIEVRGKMIQVGESSFELEYPIAEAFWVNDKLIVLFQPAAYTKRWGQFQNLVAFTRSGQQLWSAELPTSKSGDRYYRLVSRDPLIVTSIYSFECRIDPDTGQIESRTFFK